MFVIFRCSIDFSKTGDMIYTVIYKSKTIGKILDNFFLLVNKNFEKSLIWHRYILAKVEKNLPVGYISRNPTIFYVQKVVFLLCQNYKIKFLEGSTEDLLVQLTKSSETFRQLLFKAKELHDLKKLSTKNLRKYINNKGYLIHTQRKGKSYMMKKLRKEEFFNIV